MESPLHDMNALFAQLGLASTDEAVEAFIERHAPIPESVPLSDAAMWNDSQAALLREAVAQDADWSEVVDQLDALLRGD